MADNLHDARIAAIVTAFEEAMARFESRLAAAPAGDAERPRADGGWSAAQIAWHVAAVNGSFAAILEGTLPVAQAADAAFTERRWEEIGAGMAEKLEAPRRVQPVGPVTREEAAAKLSASRVALVNALRALTPERAVMTMASPIVGRVSLYQVGEWATVHVIRHNKQMKAALAV